MIYLQLTQNDVNNVGINELKGLYAPAIYISILTEKDVDLDGITRILKHINVIPCTTGKIETLVSNRTGLNEAWLKLTSQVMYNCFKSIGLNLQTFYVYLGIVPEVNTKLFSDNYTLSFKTLNIDKITVEINGATYRIQLGGTDEFVIEQCSVGGRGR